MSRAEPLAPATRRPEGARHQVGLMLSIGLSPEDNPKGNYPVKLDHFRAKPGQLEQFAGAAAKFEELYGPEPRAVDVVLVSDEIRDVLDVRPKVWGQSGLKAMGVENLAEIEDEDEFRDRLYSFEEELTVYPDDSPEPASYTLSGREDPVVAKLGCKVYGTLHFAIPDVTGLMTLAEITTTSSRSIQNFYSAIRLARKITSGRLVGVPLVLGVRPATTRYFDKEAGRRRKGEFYELVLETRHSLTEIYELVQARRQALETPPERLALPEGDPGGSTVHDPEAEPPPPSESAIVEGMVEVLPRTVPDEAVVVETAEGESVDSFFQIPEKAKRAAGK